MVCGHKWCCSNSTVLLPYLIGTNEVQFYFMLPDLSYLPEGCKVFLPVNCLFIAVIVVLMVIILPHSLCEALNHVEDSF